jgi:HD superfamily phosphohydrolase
MIVTDPVHRILDFGPRPRTKEIFRAIVNSREFQRLRRISQLGLVSYVFPGATHTRFAHCLGAGYLGRIAVRELHESTGKASTDDSEEIIMCAGLLHDVGHGPFSHLFEKVTKAELPEHPKRKKQRQKHEWWGQQIFDQRIAGPLGAISTELAARVRQVLYGEHDSPQGQVPSYLRELISSQLDVDRMDYLVRDAHFTGVSLGQIDVTYLIKSLTIVQKGNQEVLGLTPKGVKPYEAFALARHLMNRSVYYHSKVRVLEYMMELAIRKTIEELPAKDDRSPLIPEYIRLLATSTGGLQASALSAYLDMTEDSIWTMLRHVETAWGGSRSSALARLLFERKVLKHFPIKDGHERLLRATLTERSLAEGADFEIIESPSTVYKDSGVPVLVEHAHSSRTEPITRESFAVGTYRDRPEDERLLVVTNDKALTEIKDALRATGAGSVAPPSGVATSSAA